MKYFITGRERQGTCYFEFQQGEFGNKFWLEDSPLLDADIFDELELGKYLRTAVPEFDYYGITQVSREQWNRLLSIVKKGSRAEKLFKELTPWAEECFKKYDTFAILGI